MVRIQNMTTYTVDDLITFLGNHNRVKATMAIRSNISKGHFNGTATASDLSSLINNLGNWGNTREGRQFWQDLSNHVRNLSHFLKANSGEHKVVNPADDTIELPGDLYDKLFTSERRQPLTHKELAEYMKTRRSSSSASTHVGGYTLTYGTSGDTGTPFSNG
jgi:hypothetical protein